MKQVFFQANRRKISLTLFQASWSPSISVDSFCLYAVLDTWSSLYLYDSNHQLIATLSDLIDFTVIFFLSPLFFFLIYLERNR